MAWFMFRYFSETCVSRRQFVHLNHPRKTLQNDFRNISWLLAMICTMLFCPICKRHMSACFLNNRCLALLRLEDGKMFCWLLNAAGVSME